MTTEFETQIANVLLKNVEVDAVLAEVLAGNLVRDGLVAPAMDLEMYKVLHRQEVNLADMIAKQRDDKVDLIELVRDQREWSEKTFGGGKRTLGVVDHIKKELQEILDAPDDVEEWIDVVILALDGAWRTGASPAEVVEVLKMKYAKNRDRTWPDWREYDEDEAILHVKEEVET